MYSKNILIKVKSPGKRKLISWRTRLSIKVRIMGVMRSLRLGSD